jgi:hypothetical protein
VRRREHQHCDQGRERASHRVTEALA